jgi:hypothetical protein
VVKPQAEAERAGLFFSLIDFAPKTTPHPFISTRAGLQGLIPGRDQDQVGVAFAYGNYSFISSSPTRGGAGRVYEAVLEFDYRIQVNKWLYAQPVAYHPAKRTDWSRMPPLWDSAVPL